jgi:hypothetical protein
MSNKKKSECKGKGCKRKTDLLSKNFGGSMKANYMDEMCREYAKKPNGLMEEISWILKLLKKYNKKEQVKYWDSIGASCEIKKTKISLKKQKDTQTDNNGLMEEWRLTDVDADTVLNMLKKREKMPAIITVVQNIRRYDYDSPTYLQREDHFMAVASAVLLNKDFPQHLKKYTNKEQIKFLVSMELDETVATSDKFSHLRKYVNHWTIDNKPGSWHSKVVLKKRFL